MAEIDTSIYQQQRQPDLMDSMSKMIQMKSLLQNQATQAQAQEMGGLQLEEKRQQMQDQDLLRTGYKLVGGDLGKLVQWGAKNGLRPATLQALTAADLKTKAEITKIQADQIPIEKERNGRIMGVIDSAQSMTDEQRQAAWPMIVSAMGAIHPRSPLSADHVLSREDLELLKLGVQNHDDQMKARESNQKTKTWQDEQAMLPTKIAEQKTKLAKDQLEVVQAQLQAAAQTAPKTNQADWDAWLGTLPEDLRSRFPAMFSEQGWKVVQRMGMKPSEAAAADTAELNAKNNVTKAKLYAKAQQGDKDAQATLDAMNADEIKVAATKAANSKAAGGTGLDFPEIKEGTPAFRIAQDLAYGKLRFSMFRTLTSGPKTNPNLKQALYAKAADLNPGFNPSKFEMGYALAASPKVAQQLASMDNVIMGVPDLLAISDQASRSGSKFLNQFITKGGIEVAGKKYSNLHAARIGFADELSGALGYGGATDMSKEMGLDMTDTNLSPEDFKASIQDVVVPFILRKRKSLLDQMGQYGTEEFNPAAGKQKEAEKKAGGGAEATGSFSVTGKSGKVYKFPTQAAADAFKKEAGL